jgi:hypothetical protein
MSQLTSAQVAQTAQFWALQNFVTPNVTANFSLTQIQSAVSAVDAAFDTTLNAAVVAVGGTTTIVNGLSAQITTSMPGASAQQQTLLCCYVLMKRAGII